MKHIFLILTAIFAFATANAQNNQSLVNTGWVYASDEKASSIEFLDENKCLKISWNDWSDNYRYQPMSSGQWYYFFDGEKGIICGKALKDLIDFNSLKTFADLKTLVNFDTLKDSYTYFSIDKKNNKLTSQMFLDKKLWGDQSEYSLMDAKSKKVKVRLDKVDYQAHKPDPAQYKNPSFPANVQNNKSLVNTAWAYLYYGKVVRSIEFLDENKCLFVCWLDSKRFSNASSGQYYYFFDGEKGTFNLTTNKDNIYYSFSFDKKNNKLILQNDYSQYECSLINTNRKAELTVEGHDYQVNMPDEKWIEVEKLKEIAAANASSVSQKTPEQLNEQGMEYFNSKEYTEAVKYFRQAAEKGNASGQNNLGWCYQKGLGVQKNETEAVKWYRKAAEQNNGFALNQLGWCYEYGLGVFLSNKNEALKYYRLAVAAGNEAAKENLARLDERINRSSKTTNTSQKSYNETKLSLEGTEWRIKINGAYHFLAFYYDDKKRVNFAEYVDDTYRYTFDGKNGKLTDEDGKELYRFYKFSDARGVEHIVVYKWWDNGDDDALFDLVK